MRDYNSDLKQLLDANNFVFYKNKKIYKLDIVCSEVEGLKEYQKNVLKRFKKLCRLNRIKVRINYNIYSNFKSWPEGNTYVPKNAILFDFSKENLGKKHCLNNYK